MIIICVDALKKTDYCIKNKFDLESFSGIKPVCIFYERKVQVIMLVSKKIIKKDIDNKNFEVEVSIAIIVYNPEKGKLLQTIQSVLSQKDLCYEIVIADDGSENNYFDEIEQYFKDIDFIKFKLVANPVNRGTVKNFLSALQVCDGKYIKAISPGDYFFCDNILHDWVKEMEATQSEWSFGDAIYYRRNINGEIKLIKQLARPQIINPYLDERRDKCRWNYLVQRDVCLGAATLCLKETALKYGKLIENKVIYCEDVMYYLMMFDNVDFLYFSHNVIFYEYGTGVSTSKIKKWSNRLKKDWDETGKIIITGQNDKLGEFEKQVINAICIHYISNYVQRKFRSFFIKGKVLFLIKCRIIPRKTSINL